MKTARGRGVMMRGSPMVGDPGLFGAIGGALKGAVGSLFSGGNPLIGAVRGGISGFRGDTRPAAPQVPNLPVPIRPGPGLVAPPTTGTAVATRNGSYAVSPAGTKIKCPKGHHPNKSSYFLKNGQFVPEGSRCVKNRRRDPMNPRALRRAIGRVEAGKAWQGKLAEISTGKWTASGKRKDKC